MGPQGRARLSLVALLATTVLAFNQVFARGDFAAPVLTGMAIAGGIAAATRRGVRTSLMLVSSAGALVCYLCLVFAGSRTFYGLPTPSAVTELWRPLTTAYEFARIDFAPVPLRSGYVIVLVASFWVATSVAEIATFRHRRPLLASAAPIALFATALVLGSGEGAGWLVPAFLASLLTLWALESSRRLRSWGELAPRGGSRDGPDPGGVTARRMGAATLTAALVAPLVLPAADHALLSWRTGESGRGVANGGGGRVDPLVSLAPQLLAQSDKELFRVEARAPSYWRLTSLTRFDGERWTPRWGVLRALEGLGPQSGDALPLVPPNAPIERLAQRFWLTGLAGNMLPAAAQVRRVTVHGGSTRTDKHEIGVDEEGSLQVTGDASKLSYSAESLLPALTYRELRRARPASGASHYTELPLRLSGQVRDIAARWTKGSPTPLDKLIAIQNRLREFDYSLKVPRKASSDYLTEFLTKTKEGYCQQFATAFAVLARIHGYATRVSVGFLPGDRDPNNPDRFIARGTHAHAWPEVYFEGYGWVPFEPTPRSATGPPSYTVSPPSGGSAGAASGGGAQRLGSDPRGRLLDARDGGPRGDLSLNEPADGGRNQVGQWQEGFERLARFLLLAAAAFVVAVPSLKRWRTARRYRRARSPSARVGAAFACFQEEAADLASPRSTSESASSYARRLAASNRVAAQPALRLAALHDEAEYGPEGSSPDDAARARALAAELGRQLWARASWPERARRLFSPGVLAGALRGPA